MALIYLAGGCFWGLEKYLDGIRGVLSSEVGYANGNTLHPTYEDVCSHSTGHAETVAVQYDPDIISLRFLLDMFYEAIDPVSVNRQGNDVGMQYRSGIFYTDEADLPVIRSSIAKLQQHYNRKIAIEVQPLHNYSAAEEYHQKYLTKNPNGYCHIGRDQSSKAASIKVNPSDYTLPERETLQNTLNEMQYSVTQNGGTEPAFQNEYWNHFGAGIYVDITTGEPLFISSDKFESGCGWPSFSKPIDPFVINQKSDKTFNMNRTEVRSRVGAAHLGHVFDDGPKKTGGLRYCINSAALKFIPKEEMQTSGYGYLVGLVK